MTGADLLPTISASLINATQLSFVEDAPGTRGVLEKLSALLRYVERKPGDVRLQEEWRIMTTFLELQRIQNPGRFAYETCDDGDAAGGFVPRGRFLEPLSSEFHNVMEKTEGLVTFKLKISDETPLEVMLLVRAGNSEKQVTW